METHPIINGFIPEESKTIIVGTFPPKSEYENKPEFFFYSSVRNHLWNRMENIFPQYHLKKTSTKLKNISTEENKMHKQIFCSDKKIGFLDVFTKIERKVNDSSNDSDIIPKENIIDNGILFEHLDNNKNISRICCTYKLAYDYLLCGINKTQLQFKTNELTANTEEYIFTYNSRKISILLLYPATRSRQKGEIKDEQYRKLIFSI